MAFDPSSATLIDEPAKSSFEPSSARPIEGERSFNTPIPFERVPEFETWVKKYAPSQDSGDYDYGGAFLAGVTPDANGHWPDTFKKPNHPTFSDESIYAKDVPGKAGHWDGETFIPPSSKSAFDTASAQPVEDQSNLRDTAKSWLDTAMKAPAKLGLATANLSATGMFRWPTDKEVETPLVSPEQMRTVMPYAYIADAAKQMFPESKTAQVAAGLTGGLTETASGLTSPENATLLGAAPEGK